MWSSYPQFSKICGLTAITLVWLAGGRSESQAEYLAKQATVSAEQQTLFSTEQDSRRTAFSEFQRESVEKVSVITTDFSQKLKDHEIEYLAKQKDSAEQHRIQLETLNNKFVSSASNLVDEIQQHKKDVESLVGVIGNLGVTSGYKKVADHARKMLYVWQGITVIALLGLIFVAFLLAFPQSLNYLTPKLDSSVAKETIPVSSTGTKQNPSKPKVSEATESKHSTSKPNDQDSNSDFYQGLATRIFLSITFGIFAAYAGKQASRFFEIEQKNRRMALELEALGPFIEPLEKVERDKFRVQIGDRSFGVNDDKSRNIKDDDPVTVVGWLKSKDGLELIKNTIKDAVKDLKP